MKKYIIIRADDLGYSEGINYGILKTIKDGIIKTAGVMVNMDTTKHGLDLVKEYNCCLGLHTNISVGKPLCNPATIPSLVDENGKFKTSREYRSAKEDFVVFEDAYREINSQYLRFLDLVGRKPDYFEAHAVKSKIFFEALEVFAKDNNLKYIPMKDKVEINNKVIGMCELNSLKNDYNAEESLKSELSKISEDCYSTYVCHPGYLDWYVCSTSSLKEGRVKEVEMLCNPEIKKWIHDNNFEMITYCDL